MHFALLLLQSTPDQEQAMKIMTMILPFIGIVIIICLAIIIIPFWFICKKAGFSPWLSMLCLVPSVGILILLYVLAFADWKSLPPAPPFNYPYPPPPPQR